MAVGKIISGGQTGVDRAALDVAIRLGIQHGGWCPRGRRAEDGQISLRYRLQETPSRLYRQRTDWNVRDADVTLLLYRRAATGGTALTQVVAESRGRPTICADLTEASHVEVRRALTRVAPGVVNVAGPREREQPGIYAEAFNWLSWIFSPEFVLR